MGWAAAVALLSLFAAASASIMAVDLGSEFIKVALIKPGRTPISIAGEPHARRSDRSTPTQRGGRHAHTHRRGTGLAKCFLGCGDASRGQGAEIRAAGATHVAS
jgi:hypothetical protein